VQQVLRGVVGVEGRKSRRNLSALNNDNGWPFSID
jgi:hypothetical protein